MIAVIFEKLAVHSPIKFSFNIISANNVKIGSELNNLSCTHNITYLELDLPIKIENKP